MEYKVSYRKKDGGIQCIISYKDGDGAWKQKSKQGFKNQKESKEWQDETLDKLEKTLQNADKLNEEYKGITFKEYCKLYVSDIENHSELSTIQFYKKAIKKFKRLDNMAVEDITFIHIQGCVNTMIKSGLSTTTIKDYLGKIRTMFNNAVQPYRIILENPIANSPSNAKIKLPEDKIDEKIRALSKSELDDLLSKVKPNKDYMITLIAATCGLRIGEILGLTWKNIDFKNELLYVKEQWKEQEDGSYNLGKLKTKNSYRSVPIPPSTITALKQYNNTCVKDLVNDRLFLEKSTKSTGTRLYSKYHRLGYIISAHDLRHTYATMLIASGIDFKTAAQLLGHTVEMTMKIYSHVTEDMLLNAKNKISAIF